MNVNISASGPRLPGAGAGRHGWRRPAAPTGQLPGGSNRDCPTARPVTSSTGAHLLVGGWAGGAEQVCWGDDADDGVAVDDGEPVDVPVQHHFDDLADVGPGSHGLDRCDHEVADAGGFGMPVSSTVPSPAGGGAGGGRQVGDGDDADQVSVLAGDRRRGVAAVSYTH